MADKGGGGLIKVTNMYVYPVGGPDYGMGAQAFALARSFEAF